MTDFDRIKDRLDLLTVITQETGFSMKGPHLSECPFCGHRDCFSIFGTNNQQWMCHSCHLGGSVIDFYMEREQITKAEALKLAAEKHGIEIDKHESKTKKKGKAEDLQEQIYRLAAGHYHSSMLAVDSSGHNWFCNTRGHRIETLGKMQVGCATDGLLPYLMEQGIGEADVIKYGLARNKDKDGKAIPAKDYFWKGLIIFPIVDHTGKVLSFTCKDPQKKYPGLMLQGVKKNWFLNHSALGQSNEAFIVEGQNDEASMKDIGMENVLGSAGAPGQEQIVLLKNFYSGKTLFLWFDNDPQKKAFDPKLIDGTGGPHHIRFIYRALRDTDITVKIILHPGEAKDPDEFIQGLFKQGKTAMDIRAIVRELKDNAVDPLAWELEQIKTIADGKTRLEAFKLRKLPQALNAISSSADQEVYIDLAAKAVGISVKAVEELVVFAADLYKKMSDQFGGEAGLKRADAFQLSDVIFKWFCNGAGAKFFKTPDSKVWLYYNRKRYEIGDNLDFDTLMFQLTRLARVEKPGSIVWYYLRTLCSLHGELVEMMSWMFTDREKDTIYLNLNSSHNKIIKIAPGEEPQVIDNGTNEQSVLLALSQQIRHFEFLQTASEAEGLAALKHLLMDTTPCDGPQRYFMVCWMISTFMMHYQSDRGLLQIIASSKIGKSKVAERISFLFYGESYVGKGTGAAETRVALSNPILFLDNVENKNLTIGQVDFLLQLANSAHKPKAKSGSDSEVLYQKLFTMAIITSIEAFPGRIPELVNRTFPLMLEQRYKINGYMHDETTRQIVKQRNLILSGIMKMIGKNVLPNLSERTKWSEYLQLKHPGHDKDRNNEHVCTMMIILEALLEHIPWKKETPVKTQAAELLDKWISYWNEQESQTAISSNTMLGLLDGLQKEVCIKIRGRGSDKDSRNSERREALSFQSHPAFNAPYPNYCDENAPAGEGCEVKVYDDPEYLETFFLTEPYEAASEDEGEFVEKFQDFSFILTAKEMFTLFNRYCANQHIRNPYDGPTSLGSRLGNDKAILQKAGWTFINYKKDRQQYKKNGSGDWTWRLSKRIRAID